MKNIDVLYITMRWPSPSETFCARDVLALRELNLSVCVLALKPKLKESEVLKSSLGVQSVDSESFNLKYFFIGMWELITNLNVFIYLFVQILKYEKSIIHIIKSIVLVPSIFWSFNIIKKNPPKIVHLFWGHYPSLLGIIVKKYLPQVKLSMFLGAYDLTCNFSLSNIASKKADYLYTHAEANLEILEAKGINTSRFNVVHRGIDFSTMEKYLNGERNPYQVIIVSRLVKEKNIDKVLEVFKILYEKESRSRLVVVGDGPELKDLISYSNELGISERVHFSGYQTQLKVFEWLSSSGIFLFLSTKLGERLPNAIKEAMYFGVTPFTSKTPGIGELIENEQSGYILESEESLYVGEKILSYWNNEKRISEELVHSKIKNNFNVLSKMNQYVEIWQI